MTTRRNVHFHLPGRLRASAAIGIGLLFALAATVGPLPSPTGEPGASLAVRLPDGVRTLVLTLLALSAIILLAVQRPRRPIEDEPVASRAHERLPAWVATVGLLLMLAAVWYLVWHYWSSGDGHPIEKAFTAIAELLEFLALSRKPATSVPFFDLTIAMLLVLLALALFALMVLVALADRLEKWWAGRPAAQAGPIPDTVADDRSDLRAEPDARMAIIRAYGRFEHALAGARAPRAPWQTPMEFMRTAIARLPLPIPPVARLTTLFEIARFSDRALGAEARDAACDCLDDITAALTEPPLPETAHPRLKAGTRSGTTEPPPPETAHPRLKAGTRSGTTEPPPPETAHPRLKAGTRSGTEDPSPDR